MAHKCGPSATNETKESVEITDKLSMKERVSIIVTEGQCLENGQLERIQ